MGKLASKAAKRIMASVLTVAMIMSNMTVYASEYSEPAQQTQETVENTETGAAELPSTEDETVQDEGTQDEGTTDDTTQDEGTPDDTAQNEETTPGDDSNSTENVDGDEEPAQDGTDENVPEEAEAASNTLEAEEPNKEEGETHTIWVVGDSTVCSFTDKYYLPRYGYGTQIENYLKENSGYTVNNLAISGRSSLSFLSEGNYDTLKASIKEKDILIVGFGHNDEKAEAERYTNPNGDWQTTGSFAKTLYDNYVKLAEDKKAEVILCTPVVRRGTGTASDGKTKLSESEKHITSPSGSFAGGDYRQAIIKLGQDKNVSVVDLTDITTKLYESMTPAETLDFHARTQTKPYTVDNTHLNIYGAKMVAYYLAKTVKDNSYTALAGAIASDIAAPTKDKDLVSTPGWEDPVYSRPAEDVTTYWGDYVIGEGEKQVKFKGTAFGNLGGGNKYKDSCELKKEENGNMRIKANAGKIGGSKIGEDGNKALTGDGIAMYYYRVPVNTPFKISATAVINDIANDNQVAFGLMARDDMYIDNNDSAINSDYVVAGSFGSGGFNCFYRKDGDVVKGAPLTVETVANDKSYDLSIVSRNDGYACTFGKEPTQSGGFDFQLTGVDAEYVYIGMFASRNADVSFKNIYLEVNGQVLVDERKISYEVAVTNDGNGTASANSPASAGETIKLTATPNEGYVLDHWEVTAASAEVEAVNVVNNKFTMPASDVTVKAVFVESEFDEACVAAGSKDFKPASAQLTDFEGITFNNVEDINNEHGFHSITPGNPIINLHMEEGRKASITVETCCYGAGGGGKNPTTSSLDSSSGVVIDKEFAEGSLKGIEYTILNVEDEYVTLTLANDMYIHSIAVDYAPEETDDRKIDVWDFGAKEETDTELYNNNITFVEWLAYKDSIPKGIFSAGGDYKFGDVTIVGVQGKDRLYSDVSSLSAISQGANYAGKSVAGDTYSASGVYYCNGTGGKARRLLEISNVLAGDKIVLYMGNTSGGNSDTVHFAGQGAASGQDDTFTLTEQIQKQEFIAKYSGTYRIYAAAAGSAKPIYYRVMRVPGVKVSGIIDFNGIDLPEGYSLSFVNQTTNGETVAELGENDDGDIAFTASLAPGYTYKAALSGATGYGFTNESATFEVKDEEILTGKDDLELVLEDKDTYTFSGKIKGFASNYGKLNDLKIIMTPPAASTDDAVELDINKTDASNITFNATLAPDVKYSLVLEGVNDYKVVSPEIVEKKADETGTSYENRTITVEEKKKYNVSGGFMGLTGSADVTALTFTNVADNYVYNAAINSYKDGYSIALRDGEYLAKATVTNYTTQTHVVVNGGDVSKDLMFVSTATKSNITYAANIYVGYPDKAPNNYATVREAMEACDLMTRTADQRVTVHIAPGTYREQIIVNAPNVSFVNDSTDGEEVLLTWYYGIGYKYYSSDGYYNAERAYDKYEKKIADKWGTSVYVKSTATGFRAEGITFESSFNRYVTEEELADGVEVAGNESIRFVRNLTSDVTSKVATERATAIAIEGDKAEFKDCSFYSSQDTLYTAGTAYFKNCIIEGQTDYIFGSGNCVFDSCELSWKGYSIGSQGGYITANRPGSDAELGYLFRNCIVTANAHNNLEVVAGDWGRPWGQNAKVKFMNTKLQTADLITGKGWSDMSGATAAAATGFQEYNTTAMDGTTVNTSGRASHIMTDAAAAAVKAKDYFGTWTPTYYTEDSETTVEIQGELTLSDNGDINHVLPGHTLTVGYTLDSDANKENDASIVRWYTVKYTDDTPGEPKLVKTANGAIDKTYKVSKTDIGSYIKVTVTPATVSGKTGTMKELTLYKDADYDHIVNDGYYDPSTGSSSSLGDGVNIFLAGDSTTKDYSENGMFNSGRAENLGSWGEFFQCFFDESEVKIQNYANGGRSTRSFINEGSLAKIEAQIGAGDYLFIQFAHNDSSILANKKDVYTPLGEPDANGIYPYTAGTKGSDGKYPDYAVSTGSSAADNGTATYKWFLKQYVDMALEKGATPVLLTPVARMNVNEADGVMKDHHIDDGSVAKEAFGYCKAVKQVYNDYKAENKNVLLIDAYQLTADFYTGAWSSTDKNIKNRQVMSLTDSTHSNKLGGMLTAAAYAQVLQNMNISISEAVKVPSNVKALTVADVSNGVTAGKEAFNIDVNGNLTAYDLTKDCSERATYWEGIGNTLLTAIKTKAGELGSATAAGAVATPTATPDWDNGDVPNPTTVVLGCTTQGAKIYYTTDGSNPIVSKTKQEYVVGTTTITLTADTTIKAYATMGDNSTSELTDSKVAVFKYTLKPAVEAPTSSIDSGTAVKAGTKVELETATTTTGVQIRYTMGTDPADPTKYSTRYDNEAGIIVNNDVTIKAIAVVGDDISEVSTFTYTIDTTASTEKPAAPTSDTADGDVTIGKVVSLSTTTDGARIYYTIGKNPADPTTSNADLYYETDKITINRSAKIKAVAIKDGVSSDVATFTYNVPTTPDPVADTEAGVVVRGKQVKLKVTAPSGTTLNDVKIHYTTDRSNPKTSESKTTVTGDEATITINADTTITAYATSTGNADSDIVTYKYTLMSVPAPTSNLETTSPIPVGSNVTLTVTPEENITLNNVKIYYTTDGSDPRISEGDEVTRETAEGLSVTISNIQDDMTIRAYAAADGFKDSKVAKFVYRVKMAEKPRASVTSGSAVKKGTAVNLSTSTEGAEIWYTTALGANADVSIADLTTKFTNDIVINDDTVIYAYAKADEHKNSDIVKFVYTWASTGEPRSIQISGAELVKGTKVTLSSSTEDAQIFYTTELGADAENVTVTQLTTAYADGIEINGDTVIYAYAKADGYRDSSIIKLVYKLASTKAPKPNVESGSEVIKGTAVKLSSDTPDAKIFYTTGLGADAEDVSKDDLTTEYATDGIVINRKTVIYAYAKADGYKDSDIVKLEYTVSKTGSNTEIVKDGAIEIRRLDATYPFTGAKITPDFSVVDNAIKESGQAKVLTLGIDYTVKYANNTKENATATVTVTGKGNYVGKTVTGSFKIVAVNEATAELADLKGAKLDKIDPQDYTGEAIYPKFKLTLKGKQPVEYTYDKGLKQYVKSGGAEMDVNVAVSNNINKGTATILVTGKKGTNNKLTSVKKTFKINAIDLSKAGSKVSVDFEDSVPYAVKGATPEVTVSYTFSDNNVSRKVTLVNGRDYTVKYSANKKVGKGKFTITGKGNYAKKYTGNTEFTIEKLDMADTELVAVTAYTDLKAGKVKATVVDENGDVIKANQYTLEVYKADGTTKYNAADKITDKIYVKAVAKDAKNINLENATASEEFNVAENIAKAKVKLKAKSKEYTGAAIELVDSDLEVTLKLKGQSKTLTIANGDFEIVSYSNNINKGTATAVIKGTGDYSGTKTVKFKIAAKEMKKQTTTQPEE